MRQRKAGRIHNTFGVDTSLARWTHARYTQGSSFLATLGFDPESRWDIKPNTATRLHTKTRGWTEERGPTLGYQKAGHRYTEGVM